MPHPYEIKFPALAKKYQNTHENIGFILSVIDNYCNHFFNLNELESIAESATWDTHNSYLEFFENCIKKSGSDYTEEEIQAKLFLYIHETVNNSSFGTKNFTVPKGCTKQIGFWEKFQTGALEPDLTKNDVLKKYAFTTLDMVRTAEKGSQKGRKPTVLELRHLAHLPLDDLKNKPLYIRSSSGDHKGLSQWILLYYIKGIPHLYSESPISEEDKKALAELYKPQIPVLRGGASALSMSSGIHTIAHFIQNFGGAGLSSSADYFSLLIEWVWFTTYTHPPEGRNWGWGFFKQHVLQWDQQNHKFALLDFNNGMGVEDDNERMQMRSYFLGLDWALADTPSKALIINPKESIVTLKVTPELVNSDEIMDIYITKGYGSKAAFGWNEDILKTQTRGGVKSNANFASTLVLNIFRACAREKKLIIDLPHQFQLNRDEQALVCYLMEMNPYVCDFQNPKNNASLAAINNNLQHIFARNRWLSINDYLPPLLDEFWGVAAEYWVAYLKTSPDLLTEISEVKEFKRCVREMGIHGLIPLLQYLEQQESDLKPSFNTLLQNVERPPVFYGGCAATDIQKYTEALITHLQQNRYFPFKQFQFSFIPGVNDEILTLFTELNRQEIFDKISLIDCLVSVESKKALEAFLIQAISYAQADEHWVCPIHIPELEKPLEDSALFNAIELYGELNNILVKRARQKQSEKLVENPAFAKAAQVGEAELPQMSLPGQAKGKAQASAALVNKFNTAVNKVWDNNNKELSLARVGGLSLQMQQQQQIKQERSRCLDNEMEKGMAYADVLPSLLIDYNNIDKELGEHYQNLAQEHPIDASKAILSGDTVLQKFFHTWVNANPNVSAPHTIQKMTPYAVKMLLKYHRQLSGGLNVDNLPRGFYTQRMASGELVLGYKSTLGYSTDHDPLTMQLTNSIPKVERVLGDYRQFGKVDGGIPFDFLRLLTQMQPELSPEEKEKRYQQFKSIEYVFLTPDDKRFYNDNSLWIKDNWELFYTAYRSNFLSQIKVLKGSNQSAKLSSKEVTGLLLPHAPEVKKIFDNHEDIDYAKGLGQIYSFYGNYGLQRFSNLILTIKNRLGDDFVNNFIKNYLKNCETFSPLLQEKSLNTLEQMIAELSTDPLEVKLFETFLELHMSAVGWENITLLWKGFSYFYNHIKEMGLEQKFTPELLRAIEPKGQNLFPCFERILKSLEKIPNQGLRKEFVSGIAHLDLTEGGVPYAVCHDAFVLVDPSLDLEHFKNGAPTYKSPLEKLYTSSWIEPLYTLRALGSKSHIKPQDYKNFKDKGLTRDTLVWALHTDWKDTTEFYNFVNGKSPQFIQRIALHFHKLFYQQNQSYQRYPLAMFESLHHHMGQLNQVLHKYPNNLVFFDCYKLVHGTSQSEEHLTHIFNLFLAPETPAQHPHLEQGLLLATVFGVQMAPLNNFYTTTETLKQITRNELTILTTQLMSLDINSLPADNVARTAMWTEMLNSIAKMDKQPLEISEIRKEFMQRLKTDHGLVFKSSISGDYRLVKDEDLDALDLDQFFEQHADRLKNIFKNHIAISESEKNADPLKPLIEFFKRLQLNKTYINEVEPLVTTLEKILKDHPQKCWTAAYLNELFRALQPEDNSAGFSIGVLETLLTEPLSPFKPKPLDELQAHFDVEKKWQGILNAILSKAQTFTRIQQAHLARLAIRSNQEPEFINQLLTQLSHQNFDGLHDAVLARLLAEKEPERYPVILEQCANLVQLNPENISPSVWKSTCHLWIETLVEHPDFVQYLTNIELFDSPKKEQMLIIMAYSSFPSHRYPTVPHSDYFKGGSRSKVVKLHKQLATLSEGELAIIAACYPGKPAPDTRDLLSIIKNKREMPIDNALASFLTEEQSVFRQDYQQLSSIREFDLERTLKLTYVTRGNSNEPISPAVGSKLMLMFQYLKQLEQGKATVLQGNKPLKQMTQEELQRAFQDCSDASLKNPANERLQTQIWAILFEVLGRSTGKYPHLAQQFALIANDVLLAQDPSTILQLKTGEGKSHFVALRAARHAGVGKKVSVCTAKWSLAERDLLDYQQFFDYLKIPTANVHARSSHDSFEDAQIVYTTPGDLSLFLDEQASQGSPIEIDKKNSVALGDEFDFLYYEGQKIQFNYARHTGFTPKEMAWFYRGLNKFYDNLAGDKTPISPKIIQECYQFLANNAPEEEVIYLETLTPMTLLAWLQSAHEAASLKAGIDYTARLEQVKIGEEEFPLREIYPLTKDMQAAVGSTFSHGVHQLLAERLNAEAQLKGEAQDYHVHPESDIISSQVFSQRLKSCFGHWEGFTGTVSSSQAFDLKEEHGTAVLRVPTNQKDLRKWPKPIFFKEDNLRLERMVNDIKKRIVENKSILLCCATDAEVKAITAALQKRFTPDEFARHFLSYTNESHDSPATILRKKTQMEGSYLGQKEHGVVLIAAGFGRGDNVGVETVMLGSVHDENDLGQKGGRTARNGAEGEVLQYYLTKDINEELVFLRKILRNNSALYTQVQTELQKDNTHPMAPMADFLNPRVNAQLKNIEPEIKFSFLLSLREFLAAQDNYPSLVYHEAKAMISSEGIHLIGIADVEKKESLIKGFATYLNDLEKEWMKIQTEYPDVDARIGAFYNHLKGDLKRLDSLFEEVGEINCEFKAPKKPHFLLDRALAKPTAKDNLMAEAQRLILKLDGLSDSVNEWHVLIDQLSSLNEVQLTALLSIYRETPVIHFDGFIEQLHALSGAHMIVPRLEELGKKKLSLTKLTLNSSVQNALIGMPAEASDLATSYLLTKGVDDLKERVAKAAPLIQFSAGNKSSLSYWEHSATRDALMSLPPECLAVKPIIPLDASILLGLKSFLDRFAGTQDQTTYASLFRNFMRGMEHQPEQRKRLLNQYEIILSKSKNPELVLKQLAEISTTLSASEHFTLLKILIEKMGVEYKKPRVSIDELNGVWDDLSKAGPQLLNFLPLIEVILATEGKEYVSMLHIISQLDPELITASQEFLKVLYSQGPAEATKSDKIQAYEQTVQNLQECFAGQKPIFLNRIFKLFSNLLTSTEFLNFEDKKSLFEGMCELGSSSILENELFPKYMEMGKLLSLVYLCKQFPKHTAVLPALEVIAKHFSPSDGFKNVAVAGIKSLLDAIPSKISLNELVDKLQDFDDRNTMTDLLYLCNRFPEHAVDLTSFENVVSSLHSNYYQNELREGQKEAYIAGIKVLLDKKLLKADANIPVRLSSLNDKQKEKLFLLFKSNSRHVGKTSDTDFLPWVNYLCSQEYEELPPELQEITFPAVTTLLKKGNAIFASGKGIAQFSKPKDMTELLLLTEQYPSHADKLLALKPLITLITQMDDINDKEAARRAIGNFLENQYQFQTSFGSIKSRIGAFDDDELKRLLDYWQSIPNHAVSIMQNNLPSITARELTSDQRFVIEKFYEHEDKNTWIRDHLMSMEPTKRVAIMTFLRRGDFISQDPEIRRPKFTENMNKQLFEIGLNCYKQQISTILEAKSDTSLRGLSVRQQGQINDIMAEFSQIGKARVAITAATSAKADLKGSLLAQEEAYEKIWIKNKARYKFIQPKIQHLSVNLEMKSYKETLAEISKIKRELMQYDVDVASKQLIPKLHFWGQSRLYSQLNNIEDLVIKAWTEDARQQLVSADEFSESYLETRDRYLQQLVASLAQWAKDQRSIFKLPALNILKNIQGKNNDEIVQYLKDNPKVITILPGALKAIANEVLIHDSYVPERKKGM